jgi:signal transduction histidine kinase
VIVMIAALLIIVAASGVRLLQARSVQQSVTSDYYDALRNSQNYYISLVTTEAAVRGYALTRRQSTLAPMKDAGPPSRAEIVATVRTSIPDQTVALQELQVVDARANAWYEAWVLPSVEKIRGGGTLSVAELARGEAQFDQISDAYSRYIATARAGRAVAARHLQAETNGLFAAVVAQALIAAAGGFLLWWLLRRWVGQPVAELTREVRAVSDGNLEHAVEVSGPAEFVALGADVERMRGRLVQQLAEVETAGTQLRAAHNRLEQQAADLARSNRDLEQFAYVASHDLQEPLRKVASFCQLLQRRYADQLDERADQYIHFAVDGAKRMQQLINDLLDFSRVGRQAAEMSAVEMDECLGQALANLDAAVDQSRAKITFDPLPRVRGEHGLLVQLLQNLIGNAIKFRSDATPVIHVGVRPLEEGWEFSCADNGIGIDPAYAERVFMIFQRLHPKDMYTGTGIGLALCKRIVEYHGGRIWIEDSGRLTPGTTVRWTMPDLGIGRGAQ